MQMNPAQLHNQSQLMVDYRNRDDKIIDFFEYDPFGNYAERIKDLKDREFERNQLGNVLMKMNRKWDAPEQTIHNIERLKQEDSTVVIGGQQAGLLTGPLYTINKVISIIQFARQKEKELNTPVIPVFWIAGEDHDFDEINHVYMPKNSQMQKSRLETAWNNKQPVSNLKFDQKIVNDWIQMLFMDMQETEYTGDLHDKLLASLSQSNSFTDFFARLVFQLFQVEGVVLIDSADPDVRQLEKDHFIRLIEKQPEISDGVYQSIDQLNNLGYTLSLDADRNDGHLFYHHNEERILLQRNEEGNWVGKLGEVILSTDELIHIATDQPQLLSNNVVTRPIMQELLFPTLAFIGGPGEIAYWAALKPAFHAIGISMPPVMPRLSITYVDRLTEKYAKQFQLPIEKLINEGVSDFKADWIRSKMDPPISELVKEAKQTIEAAHQPLRDVAKDIRSDMTQLADKNLQFLFREIDFLETRMNMAIEEKYELELKMLNYLEIVTHPHGGLQERIWNPLPLLNEYGFGWIKDTSEENLSFTEEHYLIYL